MLRGVSNDGCGGVGVGGGGSDDDDGSGGGGSCCCGGSCCGCGGGDGDGDGSGGGNEVLLSILTLFTDDATVGLEIASAKFFGNSLDNCDGADRALGLTVG